MQKNSDWCGPSSATHTVTPTSLHSVCTNSLQQSGQDAGPAAVTIETRGSTTQEEGRCFSLEERTEGEEPAGVSQTSCHSENLCQAQEVQKEVKGSAAAGSPAGRNRKNKKKTSKSKKVSPEDRNRSEQRNSKTVGSETEYQNRKKSSSPPAEESVICRGEDKKTGETPSPIKPGGKHADSKVHIATIAEKQEAEKWEVNLLMCERAAETEKRHAEGNTETQRGHDSGFTPAAQSTGELHRCTEEVLE